MRIDETKTINKLLAAVTEEIRDALREAEAVVAVGKISSPSAMFAGLLGGALGGAMAQLSKKRNVGAGLAGMLPFGDASHLAVTSDRLLLLKQAQRKYAVISSCDLGQLSMIVASNPKVQANPLDSRMIVSFIDGSSRTFGSTPGQAHALSEAIRKTAP